MEWQEYERGILEMLRYDFSGPSFSVHGTVDGRQHRVRGQLSQSLRQLDAAVYRSGERTPFLIADTKLRLRRINVVDVEAFIGLMDDVQAPIGLLVASSGFTPSACRRAEGARVEVHVKSMDEALTGRWLPLAASVFPHDWVFHSHLARAIRELKSEKRDPEVLEAALEGVAFEEWESLTTFALAHHPDEAAAFLAWIIREVQDDGWVYNAARMLLEHDLMTSDLRALLTKRTDPELRQLLE